VEEPQVRSSQPLNSSRTVSLWHAEENEHIKTQGSSRFASLNACRRSAFRLDSITIYSTNRDLINRVRAALDIKFKIRGIKIPSYQIMTALPLHKSGSGARGGGDRGGIEYRSSNSVMASPSHCCSKSKDMVDRHTIDPGPPNATNRTRDYIIHSHSSDQTVREDRGNICALR